MHAHWTESPYGPPVSDKIVPLLFGAVDSNERSRVGGGSTSSNPLRGSPPELEPAKNTSEKKAGYQP